MLCVLLLYLFTNIMFIGEGSLSLELLAFSVIIGAVLIILEMFSRQKIYIKKSFLFLVMFFTCYISNIILNRPNDLKAMAIATTGGIILFYILGSLLSINFLYIKEKVLISNKLLNVFNFFYLIFSIIFIILLLNTFTTHLATVRSDLFLVAGNADYQRPGSFLSISFYIYSFIFAFFLFTNKYAKKNKTLILILFVFYCVAAIVGMALSQLFGSNNALVNIGGCLFATVIFFISIRSKTIEKRVSNTKLNIKKIVFGKLGKKLFSFVLVAFFIFLVVFIVAVNMLDVDLNKLRIIGFGKSEVTSLASRLALLDNFFVHFGFNPIFGNMSVDKLTTGEGSYVHSFVLSLLTHLGIIGFILFFTYLFIAIKEVFNNKNNFYVNNLLLLYKLVVFAGIFAIATVSVFITWVPLWFLLGFFFPPITLRKNNTTIELQG